MDSHSSRDNFLFSAGWDSLVALRIGHDQISVEFDPRACYAPVISFSACLSMRQTNATMCRPANVLA